MRPDCPVTRPHAQPVSRLAGRTVRRVLVAVALLASFAAPSARADDVVPPAPDASPSAAHLAAVRVEWLDDAFREPVALRLRAGDPLDDEAVRVELERLVASGRFASVSAETEVGSDGVSLIFAVRGRRIVSDIRFSGSPPLAGEALVALALSRGDELTAVALTKAQERVRTFYATSGYPDASVVATTSATDDALAVIVSVQVNAGPPLLIETRRTLVAPSDPEPRVAEILSTLPELRGERADAKRLVDDAEAIVARLRAERYYEAEVVSRYLPYGVVETRVRLGPRFSLRFTGHQLVGRAELEQALDLPSRQQITPEILRPVLEAFYRRRGFVDAQLEIERITSGDGRSVAIVVGVREGRPLVVRARSYPCLDGDLPFDIDTEVDGVLQEEFQTAGLVRDPPRRAVDSALHGEERPRAASPLWLRPYDSYSKQAYAAVRKHLRELLEAEGYFSAEVREESVTRAQCAAGTFGTHCVSLPTRTKEMRCGSEGDSTTPVAETCISNLARGVECAAEADVAVPILTGPRATVFDIRFEGNETFSSFDLEKIAKLGVGEPARREDLEEARTAILAHYAEEGFAFALVEGHYDVSEDATRARAVFRILERRPVTVTDIRIVGAARTDLSLIESRLSLKKGALYRKSWVDASQRQIESLGVFSSVSIGLLDPFVYSREKTVVVTVSERMPQYLDVRGGLSTGEGLRVGLEYGRRNLGGKAIGVTLSVQLGFRPPFMLFEPDVRRKYEALQNGPNGLRDLLERRNSLIFAFPDIGLGPLFRLEIEGLDVRTNQRDFGLEREAGLARLIFRPARTYWFQFGSSIERNDAQIFTAGINSTAIARVPQGVSIAFAQSLEGNWDRRDRPLAAHRGTLLSLGVEHVTAVPIGADCSSASSACSEFLRYSGRVAAYLPLYRGERRNGWVLAASLRGGVIQHLTNISRTYPDRLFFIGGADSIRGYQNSSLIPQEDAERLLDPSSGFMLNQVVLRGGDLFINPRVELRMPLSGPLDTVLFVDGANVWLDREAVDLSKLRYTIGTGLRIDTPVGPLVFDYGFNIARIFDSLQGATSGVRYWESIGEFHFSIGLF